MNLKRLKEVKHPLIHQKLAIMRDVKTDNKLFRELLKELSALMVFEIMRDVETKKIKVRSPLALANGYTVKKSISIVPILRAGLVMADGILDLMPTAKVGHLGLYRDEKTLKPVEYYCKMPKSLKKSIVLVVDPMLATGGSGSAAVEVLKKKGATDIKFICLIASKKGFEVFNAAHPEINVYTAAVDSKLNKKGYILPGLGDAGDRLFGTE